MSPFVIMYTLNVKVITMLVKLTKKQEIILILFTKNKKTNDNFFNFLDKSRKYGYNVSNDCRSAFFYKFVKIGGK